MLCLTLASGATCTGSGRAADEHHRSAIKRKMDILSGVSRFAPRSYHVSLCLVSDTRSADALPTRTDLVGRRSERTPDFPSLHEQKSLSFSARWVLIVKDDILLLPPPLQDTRYETLPLIRWSFADFSSRQPRRNTLLHGGYRCDNCHRVYSKSYSLNRHLKFECGHSPQFHCPHCPFRTKRKINLDYHIARKHRFSK